MYLSQSGIEDRSYESESDSRPLELGQGRGVGPFSGSSAWQTIHRMRDYCEHADLPQVATQRNQRYGQPPREKL